MKTSKALHLFNYMEIGHIITYEAHITTTTICLLSAIYTAVQWKHELIQKAHLKINKAGKGQAGSQALL